MLWFLRFIKTGFTYDFTLVSGTPRNGLVYADCSAIRGHGQMSFPGMRTSKTCPLSTCGPQRATPGALGVCYVRTGCPQRWAARKRSFTAAESAGTRIHRTREAALATLLCVTRDKSLSPRISVRPVPRSRQRVGLRALPVSLDIRDKINAGQSTKGQLTKF